MADRPVLGVDYDLARWTTGERDDAGLLVWHERYPHNNEWDSVRMVTLDLNPHGEGDFRNYKVPPERPLDTYAVVESEFHYDLDDLADMAVEMEADSPRAGS